VGRLALALLALSLIAGVDAGSATSPRPLAEKCGDRSGVSVQRFVFAATDGVQLYGFEAGTGSVGVVLVHESPADLCGWLPFVPSLTASGLRVLAFDLRGYGDSQFGVGAAAQAYDRDLAAAVARIRADGATHVVLMGASHGGAISFAYAPRLQVDDVISLSGETHLPRGRTTALSSAPRLRVPLLIVGTRHDHYLPVKDALTLLRRAGSKDKRTALYSGGWHGWDIVETAPYAANARALVLQWIRAREYARAWHHYRECFRVLAPEPTRAPARRGRPLLGRS
jgi:alpha-beta hydrolase superfamily lysophospholipase